MFYACYAPSLCIKLVIQKKLIFLRASFKRELEVQYPQKTLDAWSPQKKKPFWKYIYGQKVSQERLLRAGKRSLYKQSLFSALVSLLTLWNKEYQCTVKSCLSLSSCSDTILACQIPDPERSWAKEIHKTKIFLHDLSWKICPMEN